MHLRFCVPSTLQQQVYMLNVLTCLGDLVRDPLSESKATPISTPKVQSKPPPTSSTTVESSATKTSSPKRQSSRGRVTRLQASLSTKKVDETTGYQPSTSGSRKATQSLESPLIKRRRVLEMRDVALSQGIRAPELQIRSFDLEARWSQWEEDRDDEDEDEVDVLEPQEGRSRKESLKENQDASRLPL